MVELMNEKIMIFLDMKMATVPSSINSINNSSYYAVRLKTLIKSGEYSYDAVGKRYLCYSNQIFCKNCGLTNNGRD